MKHIRPLTPMRILSTTLIIALLMSAPACKQNNTGSQETTAPQEVIASTDTTLQTSATTTEAPKDPAEEIPFYNLKDGEEMLEFRYEYLVQGYEKFVLRYGIFSTTDPGFLNGTGLYLEFLNSNLEYVSSYRYSGVGFIALTTSTAVDPTINKESASTIVPVYFLSSEDSVTVCGIAERLWYMGDMGVDAMEYVYIPNFPLNKYGERSFFSFLTHAPNNLGKVKGAHILAYHDGTQAVLVDQKDAPVIDDEMLASFENITMQQLSDLLGVEYKG